MSELTRPQDFEIDGRLGRCTVCIQARSSSWTKLGNLRAHEKQKTHKDNVQLAQLRALSSTQNGTSGMRRRYQTYVEDCTDDPPPTQSIPWFSTPAFDDSESPPEMSTSVPIDCTTAFTAGKQNAPYAQQLPLDMEDALSGAVDFSSAEMPSFHGTSDITLEDVLSGAGLLDAVMNVEDDERLPAPSMMVDSGWDPAEHDELQSPTRPIATTEEASQILFGSSAAPSDVFPYPNRGMMKTDILFSSPTIRFSRSQKEAVLAWAKEMGGKDVPTLYGLDKFQGDALDSVGDPTEKVMASSGNVFYMNSIYQALARDYAHPGKRRQMHLYPEFSGKRVQEAWQASKWLVDVPDAVLTPMTRVRGKDFFVNELVYCTDSSWFIPTRFFDFEGALWAKGYTAKDSSGGLVVADKTGICPCSQFDLPWPEIQARAQDEDIFAPQSAHFAKSMPHPDRLVAEGLEVECPPLIIFIDDVSGNSSKQWNVHYSCYVSNAALPRAELEKDGNIRFVATSPHASPMEIIRAVCEDIRKSAIKPFKVWDAMKGRHVLIRPWVLFLPGDNPMQAELCSHIGLQGNHFCRMCHVGGDQAFKSSNDGFPSLMVPGRARTVTETREAIMSQLVTATHAAGEKPLKTAITNSGIKDSFAMPVLNQLIAKGKILRRATLIWKALSPEVVNKELYDELMKKTDIPLRNPLLDMEGLDVHLDTPVEPLHTHLLGVVKYFWAQTVWVLEKQGRFVEFQARLNSLSRVGLKIPNILADYMCRYRGALIGKHFKTISQVMVFAIAGLVDETLQDAWVSIGHLTVLLWETEIADIKVFVICIYKKELRDVIQETIDFAASLSPGLLTEKNKFHILAHLPDHIERFGPALLFSTERYESFNHIFRLCSIHSNRQAPSRDIAKTFANQDRCRHMASGGFWEDKATGSWVKAGNTVLRHVADNAIDARLLGLTPEKSATPGDMTLLPLPPRRPGSAIPQHPVVVWADTDAARILPALEPLRGKWHRAASFVTQSGDTAPLGSEVIVTCPSPSIDPASTTAQSISETTPTSPISQHTFASIVEILHSSSPSIPSWVVVRDSVIQPSVHPHLKMPMVHRSGAYRVIRPDAIKCVVNLQHDCNTGGCTASGTQRLRQEREDSTRTRAIVQHSDSVHYVLNLAALHNQSHLRSCLPPSLYARPTSCNDRPALHKRAAESLRNTKLQKKLAREALVRKSAESALQASVSNGDMGDVLGLSASPAQEGQAVSEAHIALSDASVRPGAVLQSEVCASGSVVTNPLTAPRGPRQRKGVRTSGIMGGAANGTPMGPLAMGRSRGGQLDMAMTLEPEAEYHIVDGLHSTAVEGSSKTAPPPQKRRRVRVQADPNATAAREDLFRRTFNK